MRACIVLLNIALYGLRHVQPQLASPGPSTEPSVPCGFPPYIEHARPINMTNGGYAPSLVVYECEPGFAATTADIYSLCDAYGVWSSVEHMSCVGIQCETLAPPGEHIHSPTQKKKKRKSRARGRSRR
eukprot:COSAG05_NODE_3572_length_1985_cov_2.571050_1_plen_128_part_00